MIIPRVINIEGAISYSNKSWMLFLKEYRAAHPKTDSRALISAANEEWKKMSTEEKKPYEDKAKAVTKFDLIFCEYF